MLEVDEDSRLGRELIAGGARYHAHFVPNDDATADFYQQACERLAAAGMPQYEISNFAKAETSETESRVRRPSSPCAGASQTKESNDNKSRHNLKYWTRQPYIGFGVDAHSMLPSTAHADPSSTVAGSKALDAHQAVRFATPDSLDAYMNRAPHTVMPVSMRAAIEESFFLGLRLNRGIDLNRLREEIGLWQEADVGNSPEFARDAIAAWKSAITQCVQDGLLEEQGSIVRLTARGRLLSNEVFARFLAEETKWEPAT
jgi:oxygen-independent coproporphyrinogen-3 oxidase